MGESPAALRKAGLARAAGAEKDLGDVEISLLEKDVLEGKTKNLTHFKESTYRIYSAAKSMGSSHVLIAGGECSETVGAMAGLAEAFGGKPGMLWLDAHGDFNTPQMSPSGYIGGMCLALACGRAPDLDLGLVGKRYPLAEERLVHVGSRALDQPEIAAFSSSPARLVTCQQVKKTGAAEVAEEAARHLDNRSDWIACHLDVDVVDPGLIPAVNYPTPGGLTLDEATLIVRAGVKTGKLRVLEVAAYNPSKDWSGSSEKAVVELVRMILS
jgi:arginase